MNIADLKAGMKNIDVVEGTVQEIKPVEKVTSKKNGQQYTITKALINDASGRITLNLWNEDGQKIKTGSKIKITNGYVSVFKNYRSLEVGKFGNLQVVQY